MIKNLSKYIASFDYFDKSLIAFSVTTGSISIASFATVIAALVGMASESFSLAFSVSIEVNEALKTTRSEKKKHKKTVILTRKKLNSIAIKIFEALTNNEISHEGFMTIFNEGKKCRELKERTRMMNSRKSDVEKITWLKKANK